MVSLDFMFYLLLVTIGYILGLYISYKKVLITHGPDSNKIKEIKYNHDGKCYMFKPKIKNKIDLTKVTLLNKNIYNLIYIDYIYLKN